MFSVGINAKYSIEWLRMSSFFASLVLCSSLIAAGLSVPQEEFLPYGSGYGDSPLPSGPDGHSSVDIPAGFVYYGQVYMQVHVRMSFSHAWIVTI